MDLFTKESTRNIQYIKSNLKDLDAVLPILQDVDVVFHIGALVDNFADRYTMISANVLPTYILLDACLKSNVSTLVYTTSGSVGANPGSDDGILWNGKKGPTPGFRDAYAESKWLCEVAVKACNGLSSLKTTICGFQVLWGPGDRFMCNPIHRKENDATIGDGNYAWSTCFIDNAVNGHILAMEKIEISNGQRYWFEDPHDLTYSLFLKELMKKVFNATMNGPMSETLLWCVAWVSWIIYWIFSPFKSIVMAPISPSMFEYLKSYLKFDKKAHKELAYSPIPLDLAFAATKKYYLEIDANKSK